MSTDPSPRVADAPLPGGRDGVRARRFVDFPLSAETLEGLSDLGFVYATPLQSETIEPILAGRDVLVRARPGSGRSASFCVPIAERVERAKSTRALVVAHTRELAQQIGRLCVALTKYRDVRVAVVTDGVPIDAQVELLADGPEIVVGMPDRLVDHLHRGTLDLSGVEIVCLDDTDQTLSFENLTHLVAACPPTRQVLLFCTELSDETVQLAGHLLHDPEQVLGAAESTPAEAVRHLWYCGTDELGALLSLLDLEDPKSALVFCNTQQESAAVASFLDRQGLDVHLLTVDLPQSRRSQLKKALQTGEVQIGVTTDLAARAVPLPEPSHIFHVGAPPDPSVYLQRTARLGRTGASIVVAKDEPPDGKPEFETHELPAPDVAQRARIRRHTAHLREAMGSLVFETYLPTVRALVARPDGEALLAAALRAFFAADRQRRVASTEPDPPAAGTKARGERRPRRERRAEQRPAAELDVLLVAEPASHGSETDLVGAPHRTPRTDSLGGSAPHRTTTGSTGEALLSADAPLEEGDKKRKKRRRRRKKGKDAPTDVGAAPSSADEEPNEALDALDDLDALLSTD